MALNRRISLWASLAISVALMCAVAAPPAAGAAGVGLRAAPAGPPPTYNVNSFNDAVAAFTLDPDFTICRTNPFNTVCTLRAAIMNANRFAGGGATINLPAGTYALSLTPAGPNDDATGDLNITRTVTIAGAGAASTIVDGSQIDRVFQIDSGVTVMMSDITIRNGAAALSGGGLTNAGNLTLNRSAVSGNTGGAGSGGGILNETSGVLMLTFSTISANTANQDDGGGILNYGSLTVNNSTLSGNSAGFYGGGLTNAGNLTMTNSTLQGNSAGGSVISSISGGGGALANAGTARIFHSTIAGNLADRDGIGIGAGGGIYNYPGGQLELWNTLLAENYVSSTANECAGDPLTSGDYNFFQTTDGCTISGSAPHDIHSGDPLLGPLQDNGGPTFTRALWAGSPAISQIPPVLCRDAAGNAPVPDQRGVPRPVGPLCDIGAYDGAQPAPLFNRNLIRNGDAENAAGSPAGADVGVPDWSVTLGQFTAVPYNSPGGFPSVPTDTVPANHGANFFAGGYAATSTATQEFDVSAISGAIDAGNVQYTLSGDLGGYADQEDNAALTATFLNDTVSIIGTATIGPFTAANRFFSTRLLHASVTDLLPVGTRTIQVVVTMNEVTGPYNDGYADNLSLVLTPPTLYLPLVLK